MQEEQVEGKVVEENNETPSPQQMEQILEQRKKEVEDFKADKSNQDKAYNLALAYKDILGTGWFTLSRASRKTKEAEMVVFQKLKLLQLFGHCTMKKGDPGNIDHKGKVVFKVHIGLEQELNALEDYIAQVRNELTQLLGKHADLLNRIVEEKKQEPVKEN